MLEDDGNLRDEQAPDDVKRSKADKVSAGTTVIYAFDRQSYCVGKVLTVCKLESKVIVHKYCPCSDGRLRIQWRPLFLEPDGTEGFHGSEPVKVTVQIKQVLMVSPLSKDGVIGHAIARQLDHSKRRIHDVVAEPDLDGVIAKS